MSNFEDEMSSLLQQARDKKQLFEEKKREQISEAIGKVNQGGMTALQGLNEASAGLHTAFESPGAVMIGEHVLKPALNKIGRFVRNRFGGSTTSQAVDEGADQDVPYAKAAADEGTVARGPLEDKFEGTYARDPPGNFSIRDAEDKGGTYARDPPGNFVVKDEIPSAEDSKGTYARDPHSFTAGVQDTKPGLPTADAVEDEDDFGETLLKDVAKDAAVDAAGGGILDPVSDVISAGLFVGQLYTGISELISGHKRNKEGTSVEAQAEQKENQLEQEQPKQTTSLAGRYVLPVQDTASRYY